MSDWGDFSPVGFTRALLPSIAISAVTLVSKCSQNLEAPADEARLLCISWDTAATISSFILWRNTLALDSELPARFHI